MKTLDQIEPRTPIMALPFTIDTPGSYYLSGNLTGTVGANGISIVANDVTLDLGGFQLAGVAGSVNGIDVADGLANIAVINGTIRDWGGMGLDASLATNCQVERLRVFNNANTGLQVDQGSTVIGCAARYNGMDGIVAGNASTVRDCSARNNGLDGIRTGAGSTIAFCSARNNTDDGVQAGSGSTLLGCTGSANTDDGINLGAGGTATNCTALENGDDGVQAGAGCTIRSCTAQFNFSDGVVVTDNCHVSGNTGDGNLAAGIHASGVANRIDGNHATGNLLGIDVDLGGNLVVRNSASGNGTNYSVVGGNHSGAIVADPTLAGPWDNFAF